MRRLAFITMMGVLAIGGCSGSQHAVEKPPFMDKIGQPCTVQFRRGDALGAGGDRPVSFDTDNFNGADLSVRGTLRAMSGDWIVVQSGESEYCIPRESVLLVRFDARQGVK